MKVGNKMGLKITYVSEETKPKKDINWRNLPQGTVFTIGNISTCLKTNETFIILAPVTLEFIHPIFPTDHMWDDHSIEVLGKLTGIEITR